MQLKLAANALLGLATIAILHSPALAVTRWIPLPVLKSVAIDDNRPAPDVSLGATLYKNCRACHDIGANAETRVGPDLTGVVGRPAASVEGYAYSESLHKAGKEGLVWSKDLLNQYLAAPTQFIPGNKMAYVGLRDAEARRDLIAYLATLEMPEPEPSAPTEATLPSSGSDSN